MARISPRYAILAALSLGFGVAAYFGRSIWLVDAFAPNLAAGFLGALVTVSLIDRNAEQQRELDRQRIERVALLQARLPLLHLAELLYDMMKASMPTRPAHTPTTYAELFTPANTDFMDWLRLDAPAGVLGGDDWYATIEATTKRVSDQLSEVIDKYAGFVGVDFIELVEAVRDDPFLHFMRQLHSVRVSSLRANLPAGIALSGTKELRDVFFPKLRRLIVCYLNIVGKPLDLPAGLASDNVAPKFGSARLPSLPRPVRLESRPADDSGTDSHWLT